MKQLGAGSVGKGSWCSRAVHKTAAALPAARKKSEEGEVERVCVYACPCSVCVCEERGCQMRLVGAGWCVCVWGGDLGSAFS